jgi:hypothetical protein
MFSGRQDQESYRTALAEIEKAHAENAKIAALKSLIAVLQEELPLRWPFYHDEETKQRFISSLKIEAREEKLLNLIQNPNLTEGYSQNYSGPRLSNIAKFKDMLDGITNHIYLSSFLGTNPRSQDMQASIDLIIAGPTPKKSKPAAPKAQNDGSTAPACPHNNTSVFQAVATDDPDQSAVANQKNHEKPAQELSITFKKNLGRQLITLIQKCEIKRGKKISATSRLGKAIEKIRKLKAADKAQSVDQFIKQILELKSELLTISNYWIGGSKTLANMLKYGFNYTEQDLKDSWDKLISEKNLEQLKQAKPATPQRSQAFETRNTAVQQDSPPLPGTFNAVAADIKAAPGKIIRDRVATGRTIYTEAPSKSPALPERQAQVSPPPRQPIPPSLPAAPAAETKTSFRAYIKKEFPATGLETLIFSRENTADNFLSETIKENATAMNAIIAMTEAIDSETTAETKELVFSITTLFLYQFVTDQEQAPKLSTAIQELLLKLNDNESRQQLEDITKAENFKPLCYEPGEIFGYTEELTTFGQLTYELATKADCPSTCPTLPAGRLTAFIETIQTLQLGVRTEVAQASSNSAGQMADQAVNAAADVGAKFQAGAQTFWSGFVKAGTEAQQKLAEQAKLTLASVNAGETQNQYRGIIEPPK